MNATFLFKNFFFFGGGEGLICYVQKEHHLGLNIGGLAPALVFEKIRVGPPRRSFSV